MPLTDALKAIFVVVMLVALGLLGYDYMHTHKELAVLQNVIENADVQAKENEKVYKENHDAIKAELANNTDILVNFYDGLLRDKGKTRTSRTPASPKLADGATTQPGISDRGIAFERDCALDALKVMEWQNWARLNKFPVK